MHPTDMKTPNSKLWRVDSRYSAVCELRWMRRAQRLGSKLSNADILATVRAKYGWLK